MRGYYKKNLNAERLKLCYDIANQRIKHYLREELRFVKNNLKSSDKVLELGCGYGRVIKEIAPKVEAVYGIDISEDNLEYAKIYLQSVPNVTLSQMNVASLDFSDQSFDIVLGIQNSISAFKINPELLISEALRVTKKEGKVLFSSYSNKIWKARLEWFEKQATEGLVGEIDYAKTRNGKIVCKDGFTASTYSIADFQELAKKMNLNAKVEEIDNSSVFLIINK